MPAGGIKADGQRTHADQILLNGGLVSLDLHIELAMKSKGRETYGLVGGNGSLDISGVELALLVLSDVRIVVDSLLSSGLDD